MKKLNLVTYPVIESSAKSRTGGLFESNAEKPHYSVRHLYRLLKDHKFKTSAAAWGHEKPMLSVKIGFMSKPLESKDGHVICAASKAFLCPVEESFINYVQQMIYCAELKQVHAKQIKQPEIKRISIYVYQLFPMCHPNERFEILRHVIVTT